MDLSPTSPQSARRRYERRSDPRVVLRNQEYGNSDFPTVVGKEASIPQDDDSADPLVVKPGKPPAHPDATGASSSKHAPNHFLAGHDMAFGTLHAAGTEKPLKHRLHDLKAKQCVMAFSPDALRRYVSGAKRSLGLAEARKDVNVTKDASFVRWGSAEELDDASEGPSDASSRSSKASSDSDSVIRVASAIRKSADVCIDDYVLEGFLCIAEKETVEIPIPRGVEIPLCNCRYPCEYRQQRDAYERGDPDNEQCFWFCSHKACTFWLLGDGSVYQVPERDADVEDSDVVAANHVLKTNAIDDQEASKWMNFTIEPDTTPEQIAEYWDFLLSDCLTVPDEEIQLLLVGTGEHTKVCDCDLACNIGVCRNTADLFWICPAGTCVFIDFCNTQSKLTTLDVGQLLPFGESTMDRFTTLTYVMRWFGHAFSHKFWRKISSREPDADYLNGSRQMQPEEKYDFFISYRGSTGRWFLQICLCGYHNILPGFLFLFAICPIVVCTNIFHLKM